MSILLAIAESPWMHEKERTPTSCVETGSGTAMCVKCGAVRQQETHRLQTFALTGQGLTVAAHYWGVV